MVRHCITSGETDRYVVPYRALFTSSSFALFAPRRMRELQQSLLFSLVVAADLVLRGAGARYRGKRLQPGFGINC
jgi:hypothetical protein